MAYTVLQKLGQKARSPQIIMSDGHECFSSTTQLWPPTSWKSQKSLHLKKSIIRPHLLHMRFLLLT